MTRVCDGRALRVSAWWTLTAFTVLLFVATGLSAVVVGRGIAGYELVTLATSIAGNSVALIIGTVSGTLRIRRARNEATDDAGATAACVWFLAVLQCAAAAPLLLAVGFSTSWSGEPLMALCALPASAAVALAAWNLARSASASARAIAAAGFSAVLIAELVLFMT